MVRSTFQRWRPSRSLADGGDSLHQRSQCLAVVDVGAADAQHQRQAVRVGEHVDLGAVLATVDRVWPGQGPPFFALRLAPSTIAADQSMSEAAPCRSRITRCSLTHTPASVRACSRRCAVGVDTPKLGGRCRHAQPVVSTNTIAVNTARSAGAVPPPCLRGTNSGINGSTISHNESGTSRNDNESATPTTIPQQPHQSHQTRRDGTTHVGHALRRGTRS